MRDAFKDELARRLGELTQHRLRRDLRRVESNSGSRIVVGGVPLLNFSSNDYLGLAHHPGLRIAAAEALARWGAGSTASRLVCGSLAPHQDLELALARFKGTEAALSFASGYATALGVIPALVGPGDVVVLDRLAHACLVDGARLSGARLRVYRHNDPCDLQRILAWACNRPTAETAERPRRTLIVTESVFSMDGDVAPLNEIVELKDRHDAWLLVDEAHATGVFGRTRRGVIEEMGLEGRVEVQFGTLGKALGAAGGFIGGPRELIDYLVNSARSFIFSTAPPPASAAAAAAGLAIVQSPEGHVRAARLWERVAELRHELAAQGWTLPPRGSPIVPLRIGDEHRTLELSAALRARGVFVPAIRYPSVGRGRARLRITVSAAHTSEEINQLLAALKESCVATGVRPAEVEASLRVLDEDRVEQAEPR